MQTTRCSGQDLLAWRQSQLAQGGRAVDFDWLLMMQGDLSWAALQKMRILPESTVQLAASFNELELLWHRHVTEHVPLQHLVGRCPWRDVELQVSPGALIPRQETELLIDLALHCLTLSDPKTCSQTGVWADLGTGSGALAVALARSLPRWKGHAVDLSAEALELARVNLRSFAPSPCCTLHLGSWWEPLRHLWGNLHLVLSNPPYIPRAQLLGLEPVVRDHEPHLALSGGDDGLDCCRAIIDEAPRALAPGGWLLLEHHHDQSEDVLLLLRNAGLDAVQARPDLQGVMRFALAQRPLRG